MLHPAGRGIPLCLVWISPSTRCPFLLYAHALSSAAEIAKAMLPWIPLHLFSWIQPLTKKNSFPHLSATSLEVYLPRRLYLLACVTSCLSHYLPVCISVCPPATEPLLKLLLLKETLLSFHCRKRRNYISLFGLPAILPAQLLYGTTQYDRIYYPHGVFYIPCLSFLTCFSFTSSSLSSQLCFQFTGRQEGWLIAAVCLPKLTASKDERPPLIALPSLLLSKASTSHPLRNCVQCTPQLRRCHSHTPWQWWNDSGVCSKSSSHPCT